MRQNKKKTLNRELHDDFIEFRDIDLQKLRSEIQNIELVLNTLKHYEDDDNISSTKTAYDMLYNSLEEIYALGKRAHSKAKRLQKKTDYDELRTIEGKVPTKID